jgi:predicted hotdog family 3-hydroxylacyl-ACP dehydratase
MLNRADIEARVPHAGAMCLLDTVTGWDASHIACGALAPSAGHPLMREGFGVPAVAAVEYAAQATAVHGALLATEGVRQAGLLAKLADIELLSGPVTGALVVRADLLGRSAGGCLYGFTVHDDGGCRARGRLMVALHDGH